MSLCASLLIVDRLVGGLMSAGLPERTSASGGEEIELESRHVFEDPPSEKVLKIVHGLTVWGT